MTSLFIEEKLTPIQVLINAARTKFGTLPVVQVYETADVSRFSDEEAPEWSGDYLVDLEKLAALVAADSHELGNFRYVLSILMAAIEGKNRSVASRKYSFGDTPDWWDVVKPETTENRRIVSIDIYVHH